jgi:pantoate--beta-alanine ligase
MTKKNIIIIRSLPELRQLTALWRAERLSIGLVPTMGALHKGHLSLVTKMLSHTDRVITSIFINPKQFGAGEDLEHYPKNEADDCQLLSDTGAHAVFIPDSASIYPEGFSTNISVAGISDVLCGASRVGHFDGVATIVTKLLVQALPDVAIFGEKDYQQLIIIKQLQKDLDLPIKIISGDTVREADGLALSSRNAYLSTAERDIAVQLSTALKHAVSEANSGKDLRSLEAEAIKSLIDAGFRTVDYFSFCDAKTLKQVDNINQATRVLAAAYLGKTRLIDNFKI